MTRPAGRYDEPSRALRVATVAGAALIGLVLLVGGYALYARHTAGSLSYEVRGYRRVSDAAILITFDVQLAPGQRGECKLRARARSGEEAGSAIVPVGPSPRRTLTTSYQLATTSRASSGEVVACRRR